jgi:light-regulated signal transduction histidine kinase (bacteriophytochrome)
VNFSQLVQNRYTGKLDATADEALGFVVQAAKRMSRLIADLLAYSHATAENERASQAVNLDEVLASVLQTLRSRIQETGAEVRHDALPVVEGDAARLEQVFLNLLGNALKYGKNGVSPVVEVKAQQLNGDWVFSVRDNGQGFKQEYAERVFGIFKRLHGPDVPGSGIGLAICKTIIERHGGKVWAESEEGRGATFSFSLPVAP